MSGEVLDISASTDAWRDADSEAKRDVDGKSGLDADEAGRDDRSIPRTTDNRTVVGDETGLEMSWSGDEPTLGKASGTDLAKEIDETDTPRGSTTTAATEAKKDWHPLQEEPPSGPRVVVDLGESMVDAAGKLHFQDRTSKTSPAPTPSPRNSHFRTGAAPSPPPWEIIPPPSDNGHREFGGGAKIIRQPNGRRVVPKSSYYFGPPPPDAAFGSMPVGRIGVHYPREVIRIERDYSGGELIQFAPIYPLELEGRITPTQFLESINSINERLIEAHSMRRSALEVALAVATLYLSRLVVTSHYDKEMARLKELFGELNVGLYNPAGLNLLWPSDIAFLFMEIEYY